MNFASLIILAATAAAVDTRGLEDKTVKESRDPPLLREPSARKRSLRSNKNAKKEVEVKKKDGGSMKISKSTTHKDDGALTPAVMDNQKNNRIRLINQILNDLSKLDLANLTNNGANSGIDSIDVDAGDSADIKSKQTMGTRSENEESTKHINLENTCNHPTTRFAGEEPTHASVGVDSPVVIGSPEIVNTGSTDVCCGGSAPVVTAPVVSRPVVVNPIITGGVCCGQSEPTTTVPVSVVAVKTKTGHSHGQGLLRKYLEKSANYHRRKQTRKQLLGKLAAKKQQTSVVALGPVHHVHTPDNGHLNPIVSHSRKYRGLKDLFAYKQQKKTLKNRNKISTKYEQKCSTCCCN